MGIQELEAEISKLKSLNVRNADKQIVEAEISKLEAELDAKIQEIKPDVVKKYYSKLLNLKMEVNLTKGIVKCSDGAVYTEKELLGLPSGLGEKKLKIIHEIKKTGAFADGNFQEFKGKELHRAGII